VKKIGSTIVVDDFGEAKLVPAGERVIRKKVFPVGIFLILFFIESLVAAGACLSYFIYAGRNRISDIENYTRNYSIPMAEAFANVAELSHQKKSFTRLKRLFRKKINENAIDEAFFVLRDGTIVVHSDASIEKRLNGNIANDELAYNLDLILKPMIKGSRDIQFTEYNIVGTEPPFRRQVRMLMKRHLYNKIDNTGWLVSRAVFRKGKPVGTVNFIISKQKIYRFLYAHIEDCATILIYSLLGALALSLTVSLIVLLRYRGIQRKTAEIAGIPMKQKKKERIDEEEVEATPLQDEEGESQPDLILVEEGDMAGADELPLDLEAGETEKTLVMHIEDGGPADSTDPINLTREIKDAIPVEKAEQNSDSN
jgi:hypothetical protein